jgi:ADP-ribose pyrophosphatase YjhB (NUDIX family)
MVKFTSENTTFSLRSAGVLIDKGRVLVQKRKGDKFWALPGGRVELGERSEITPVRELEEEIGVAGITIQRLLYIAESFFEFNSEKHHQIAFYYMLNAPENFKYSDVEEFDGIEEGKNIIYSWINLKEIATAKIKPDFLTQELANIVPHIKHIVECE